MGRMQIVYRSIKDILPYEKNPRINDEAVPVVKESIKEFGFRIPIVIDVNDVIVAGHGLLYGSCVLTHIRRYHAQPRHSISCSISFGLRSVNGSVTIKR